jgi:hypothetical protein
VILAAIFTTGFAALTSCVPTASAQTPQAPQVKPQSPFSVPIYPLSDIKIGQKAVGKTVFQGDKVEEFEVEILGVMRNVQPRKNLIFSRVSGGPLERTGVMAGMSGSPVYIDGKLVGAISMTFQFIKEPLAGITPIEDMIDSLERSEPAARVNASSSASDMATVSTGADGPRVLLSQIDPKLSLPAGGASRVVWGGTDTSLLPVATPLNLSGFTAEAIDHFAPQFKSLGWVPVQGGGAGIAGVAGTPPPDADKTPPPPPQPGSMISVQLVRGDMAVAADGTVTHVENGRLYAFGHPFLSAGPVELPFTEASVIAGVPSYANSMKISTPGRTLGVISQDQASGIGGILGKQARMVPVELQMISDSTPTETFNVEVAADRFLMPFLMNLTVFSAIGARERQVGDATFVVEQDIALRNLPAVQLENYITTPANGAAMAARAVVIPLSVMMQGGLDPRDVERIKLKITTSNTRQAQEVKQVWASRREAKPGETVELTVVMQDQDGREKIQKTDFQIPLSMRPGPLSIFVADGTTLDRMEAASGARGGLPKDPALLVKAINRSRGNNRLYVRLQRPEVGFMVDGEALPSLPPSLVSTLTTDPSVSSNVSRTALSTVEDYEMPPVEGVIAGFKALSINVE